MVNFAPFLRSHGVNLAFRSSLRDSEYKLLMSNAPPWRKAWPVLSSGARTLRFGFPEGSIGLIHRLAAVTPLPGDPPGRLDIYDFDDALYLGSISSANRRFRGLKQEAARFASYAPVRSSRDRGQLTPRVSRSAMGAVCGGRALLRGPVEYSRCAITASMRR